MKLRNIIAAGLMASMALVACNKENSVDVADNAPRSVSINIANLLTKSPSDFIEPNEDGTLSNDQIALNNFQIFFTDGKKIYGVMDDAGNIPGKTYFSSADEDLPTTVTYHYVPASVSQVVVIGNQGELVAEADFSNETNTFGPELSDITGNRLIADEQDYASLTLYGDNKSLQDAGSVTHTVNGEEHVFNLYKADVVLAPLVSRIEFGGFYCEFAEDTEFESLVIDMVVLDKYYEEGILTTEDAVTAGTYNYKNLNEGNIYTYFSELNALTTNPWYVDTEEFVLTPEVPLSELKDADGNLKALAYHTFSTEIPNLAIRVTATKANRETTQPYYLLVTGFKEGTTSLTTFERGSIYKLQLGQQVGANEATDPILPFDEENLKDPEKCIEVTVSVNEWKIVRVTPEF